jgi:hypothetical protein
MHSIPDRYLKCTIEFADNIIKIVWVSAWCFSYFMIETRDHLN